MGRRQFLFGVHADIVASPNVLAHEWIAGAGERVRLLDYPNRPQVPRLGPDGGDGPVERRLLRRPQQRQPREGPERGGVFKMKRQLLIAQLAMPGY